MGNSIFEPPVNEVKRVQCTITNLAPLTVTIGSTVGILGIPVPGATYSLGVAVAELRRVGRPRIF